MTTEGKDGNGDLVTTCRQHSYLEPYANNGHIPHFTGNDFCYQQKWMGCSSFSEPTQRHSLICTQTAPACLVMKLAAIEAESKRACLGTCCGLCAWSHAVECCPESSSAVLRAAGQTGAPWGQDEELSQSQQAYTCRLLMDGVLSQESCYLSRHWRTDSFLIPPSCPLQRALLTIWTTSPSCLTGERLGETWGAMWVKENVWIRYVCSYLWMLCISKASSEKDGKGMCCRPRASKRYQVKDNGLGEGWELAKKLVKFIVFSQLYSSTSIDLIEIW